MSDVRYYLMALIVVIAVPIALLITYDQLAGGLLNGLWGSWRRGVVHPNLLLWIVNPLIIISSYCVFLWSARGYISSTRRDTRLRVVAWSVAIVTTIIVLVMLVWPILMGSQFPGFDTAHYVV